MSRFTLDTPPARIVFGAGSIDSLPEEIDRLGRNRVFLVSTPGRSNLADEITHKLGARIAGTFARAEVHVPEGIASDARDAANAAHADCIVAVGGGSAIGVAKAIAVELPVPIVAVPTTYGGSEMTPVWGLTRGGQKETRRDARVQPGVVIYDPLLTLSLPPKTTACSGLNAIAHCVEALYAADANPLSTAAASTGIRLLAESLTALAQSPRDEGNRSTALQGAWLAGYALGTVQMGFHHKLSHTLGGSFNLPHAETHAVLLPYTAAFNRAAASGAMRAAAQSLGATDAPSGIGKLAATIGAPLSLNEIGFREEDIERAAELAVEKQYPNPRAVTIDGVRELLAAAFRGDAGYYVAL